MKTFSIIKPFPHKSDIQKFVETLIEPAQADREAKALIDLLDAVTDADADESCIEAASVARHHAFQMTMAYQTAYDAFCGVGTKEEIRIMPDSGDERENEEAGDLLH